MYEDEEGNQKIYSLVHEHSSKMEGTQPTIRFYLKDSKPGIGDAYADGRKSMEEIDSKFVESWSGRVMNMTSQSFKLELDAEGNGEYELTSYGMSIGRPPTVETYTIHCADWFDFESYCDLTFYRAGVLSISVGGFWKILG